MKDMLIIFKFSCLFLHISKYGVLVNYFDFFSGLSESLDLARRLSGLWGRDCISWRVDYPAQRFPLSQLEMLMPICSEIFCFLGENNYE